MESTEKWLPVVGYEGIYEVSDRGQVRSFDRLVLRDGRLVRTSGRMMRQRLDRHNYYLVGLSSNSIVKTKRVHRLVAAAFIGEPGDGMEVCHNNGNPSDNRLANLRWGTKRDNVLDQVRHGTHQSARRVLCKRGHLLAHPNLVPAGVIRGVRQCLACMRARSARGKPFDMEYADAAYAQIMAQ